MKLGFRGVFDNARKNSIVFGCLSQTIQQKRQNAALSAYL